MYGLLACMDFREGTSLPRISESERLMLTYRVERLIYKVVGRIRGLIKVNL